MRGHKRRRRWSLARRHAPLLAPQSTVATSPEGGAEQRARSACVTARGRACAAWAWNKAQCSGHGAARDKNAGHTPRASAPRAAEQSRVPAAQPTHNRTILAFSIVKETRVD